MSGAIKTVAEKLRDYAEGNPGFCGEFRKLTMGIRGCEELTCTECRQQMLHALADMIEAEQAELRKQSGVDVDALLKLADEFEEKADNISSNNSIGFLTSCDKVYSWASAIRDALKNAKPQLPEGIVWPRFSDGELVKLGDRFVGYHAKSDREHEDTVSSVHFKKSGFKINGTVNRHTYDYGEPVKRPEPEVLDADGAPIKVGDTVWHEADGSELTVVGFRDEKEDGEVMVNVEGKWFCVRQFSLTHRKPDSWEIVATELVTAIEKNPDGLELDPYIERFRKLMGGE